MPTLHNVIDKTKQGFKLTGIAVAVIILLLGVYRGILATKDYFFPKPPTPPRTIFGKLPQIIFPKSQASREHTYAIDTLTGRLPVFIDKDKKVRNRIAIHKITQKELTLLDLQNTVVHVGNAGFQMRGVKLEETIYQFSKQDGLPKTLSIDIVTNNFTLTSEYATHQQVLSRKTLPDEPTAVDRTVTLLKTLAVYPTDIDPKKTRTQLLKIEQGTLLDAEKLSDAHIVRVDLFQKDIEDIPIFYPKALHSSMNFLVASGARFDPDIVLGEFFHQTIMTTDATYPLKPVSQAYKELTDGQAYVSADFTKEKEVKIKEVLLGYYLTDTHQEFLMPIYIFKGRENEFFAYVSALSDGWIAQATSPAEKQE